MPSVTNLSKPPSIIHGPSHPPLLNLTFGKLIRQQSEKHADRIAVISQHQNDVITFSQLHALSDDLAAGLFDLGVRKGDRVAVLLGNRSEYVHIFLACAKVGALVTLLNYAYTTTEILRALISTTPKILFTTLGTCRFDYRDCLSQLEQQVPSLRKVVLLDDTSRVYINPEPTSFFGTFSDILDCGRQQSVDWIKVEEELSDTDILNLQFTSGSTGAPKAAALTHHGIINCSQYIGVNMNVSPDDKIVVPVPLFHAFGLIIGLCTTLILGAATVLPSEYFDAKETLNAVERYQCTGLYGVTTMFIDELSHPDFSNTARSFLRFGVMAGSAMPEELLIRIMTKFPIRDIYTNWGMTELSSIATMTSADDPISKKQKTAGKLIPNLSAKIVSPNTDKVLPWGERGEIVLRGFSVMHSYFRDEERTEMFLRYHGREKDERGGKGLHRKWMHTGDEGYLDTDGYLVVTGRIKDLIIRGGENIAPLEIEERLFEHPAIKQACVFGIPSQRYGEVVATFLELEDSLARPSDDEVRDWVRVTLSRFKVPVRIWWLGDIEKGCPVEWPKTANGKLRKKDIREIGARLAEGDTSSRLPHVRERL